MRTHLDDGNTLFSEYLRPALEEVHMHKLLTTSFPHRHNADGSHVAICRRCFATLATVKNEGELEIYEVQHKCDRLTLYQSLFPAPEQGFLLQRLLMDKISSQTRDSSCPV